MKTTNSPQTKQVSVSPADWRDTPTGPIARINGAWWSVNGTMDDIIDMRFQVAAPADASPLPACISAPVLHNGEEYRIAAKSPLSHRADLWRKGFNDLGKWNLLASCVRFDDVEKYGFTLEQFQSVTLLAPEPLLLGSCNVWEASTDRPVTVYYCKAGVKTGETVRVEQQGIETWTGSGVRFVAVHGEMIHGNSKGKAKASGARCVFRVTAGRVVKVEGSAQ